MTFLRQKTVWLGFVAMLLVLMVFGMAMMGSVLGAKPKNLPVALVVEDQSVTLPNGSELGVGAMLQEKLLANQQLPVAWKIVGTEKEAREGLDQQKYYGALILPTDLSARVASLQTDEPQPADVKIISNDGLSAQASASVKQILTQLVRGVNAELAQQILGAIGQQSDVVPLRTVKALLAPVSVQEESVHPVGENNASGNAPGLLTQMMWIGSLALSVTSFLALKNAAKSMGGRTFSVLLIQAVAGSVFIIAASGFLVWMSTDWYGMSLDNVLGTWTTLVVVGLAFFFLQTALLSWLGMGAMAVLVLLMFFSMSVVNMAPEFLPLAAHDWLYVWTPFRFAVSALRNAMYFDGIAVVSSNLAVLLSIIAAGLILHLASAVKKIKSSESASAAA